MATGVRNVDRPGMPRAVMATHAAGRYRALRTGRLRSCAALERLLRRAWAGPDQPANNRRRDRAGRVAHVRDADAAVLLRATAVAGVDLWRDGVSVALGTDRANDLQLVPGAPLSNIEGKY